MALDRYIYFQSEEQCDVLILFKSFIIVFLKVQTIVDLISLSVKVNLYFSFLQIIYNDNTRSRFFVLFFIRLLHQRSVSAFALLITFQSSVYLFFLKNPIKIRNVLFILFWKFVCFCCYHSPLINWNNNVKFLNFFL